MPGVPVPQPKGLDAIAGMNALKSVLLRDVVAPLKNPDRFARYGLTIPNGILLFGPPGCGKTYIARKLAEELGFGFIELPPSEVGSPYVHASVLKIRDSFERAASRAPVVLFIDEFEGLAPRRADLDGSQQFKAEEISELLVQIGDCAGRGILLIAATNLLERIDPAILRTGRIDQKIFVGPPDSENRAQILRFYLRNRPVSAPLDDLTFSSAHLGGYSASDIKVLVDEAARLALDEDSEIKKEHLTKATSVVPPSLLSDEAIIAIDRN